MNGKFLLDTNIVIALSSCLFLILLKCQTDLDSSTTGTHKSGAKATEKDSINSINYRQILLTDSLLHTSVKHYIADTSVMILMEGMVQNIKDFRLFRTLGDINGDNRLDSVFLVPELIRSHDNSYEEGITLVFSDSKIPPIKVNQMCVQFQNFFVVGDIDEDGWMELGQYYSSCASRYKTLILLRCDKKSTWKEVEYCAYDTYSPEPHFSTRIRKIKKNQYEMTEITDDNLDDFGKLKKIVRYTIAD